MTPTPHDILALDAADPLRAFRDRFALPPGVIYLDGNSLGALPTATASAVADAVSRQWGEGLIRSWNDAGWMAAAGRVGGKVARLIGAAAHEVVVADSTSTNIYKLLAAGLDARPGRRVILTEAGNFPTDVYVAQGLSVLAPDVTVRAVPAEALRSAMTQDVAVVMLTEVHYKTATRHDMAGLTAAAHAAGALAFWDLSHSAGAIAVDLRSCGVDMAVGCGYKYLNGGPGAPAFLFVAEALQTSLRSPLTGWLGHAAPFAFEADYRPAPDISCFLCGTPPVLGMTALEVGVDLALEAEIGALTAKSAGLWNLFAGQMTQRCGGFGFHLISPADPARRGSHIAYGHPAAYQIMQALIARGVIGDFRRPDVLRFGLTPLYLGYGDIWRAVEILYEIMQDGTWRNFSADSAGRVT